MVLTLSCPGKTFLLGEYLALVGGPSLIINTSPRFLLTITKHTQAELNYIHADSPAGRFILENLPGYKCTFGDPHNSAGGFGASSAQFTLAYCAMQKFKREPVDLSEMLETYYHYAWNGSGLRPSGADVIAQVHGGIAAVSDHSRQCQRHAWPWDNLGFMIVRTGQKLATHDHLRETPNFDADALARISQQSIRALEQKNALGLVMGVQSYAQQLADDHLVAPLTQSLVASLQKLSGVLASKGCGAMGADTVLVLYEKAEKFNLTRSITQKGLKLIASETQLTHGLTPTPQLSVAVETI